MSKYIDADKFIKKFEKMIDDIPASVDSGAGYIIDEVYKIFDSLQQEQSQVADASKMEQPEALEVSKFCQPVPENIANCVAEHFWEMLDDEKKEDTIAQQEQSESSVENYIQSYLEAIGFGYGGWVDGLRDEDLKKIARHFYKLGLKARKEE